MSHIYGGNYRIVDLRRWHLWWPWIPVRLTEVFHYRCEPFTRNTGKWRWLYVVERRLDYNKTYCPEGQSAMHANPPYTAVWEYRDVGERDAKSGIERIATG